MVMADTGLVNGGVGDDDLGDGMQCSEHPFRSNPGGICALCLQEKLGKLVSSSLPLPLAAAPSSSASSSPSFRSDFPVAHSRAAATRIPFLLAKKKKKVSAAADLGSSAVFKRSKSTTAAPRRTHFDDGDYSPRKRGGFWSFLHLSHPKTSKVPANAAAVTARADVDHSSIPTATERKVSRSRSVGCGSRSFSGDFFERISTGFGDCTLRRVESQREGKHNCTIKERVKCGGIFGGFIMTSSSSSSSSSSYWVSEVNANKANGRSRSWGWALASPMRAFSKPSSGKRASDQSNTTPNLAAIPSLLAARG